MACTEVSIRLEGATDWIKLRSGTSSIGRKKTNQVYVDNPKCSRVHATILWQDQQMPILEATGRTPIFFEDGQTLEPGNTCVMTPHQRFFLHGNPAGWVRESLLELKCVVVAEESPCRQKSPVGASESSDQCPICMEPVNNQAWLEGCTHTFCLECIKAWTKVENRCPMCKSEFTRIKTQSGAYSVTPRKQRCVDSSSEAASMWINEMVCTECNGAHDEQLLIICDGGCGAAQHSYCVGLGRTVPSGDYFCRQCRVTASRNQPGGPGTYVAKDNETVAQIAQQLNLDVYGLVRANQNRYAGLSAHAPLEEGTIILVEGVESRVVADSEEEDRDSESEDSELDDFIVQDDVEDGYSNGEESDNAELEILENEDLDFPWAKHLAPMPRHTKPYEEDYSSTTPQKPLRRLKRMNAAK